MAARFVRAAPNILTGIPVVRIAEHLDRVRPRRGQPAARRSRLGTSRSARGPGTASSWRFPITLPGHRRHMRILCNSGQRSRPPFMIRMGSDRHRRAILDRLPAINFFNTSPDNSLSYKHFYRDVQMYATGPMFPVPDMYFVDWYAGPDNSNVAQMANDWQGGNFQRYVNPAFDALYEESTTTKDLQTRGRALHPDERSARWRFRGHPNARQTRSPLCPEQPDRSGECRPQ